MDYEDYKDIPIHKDTPHLKRIDKLNDGEKGYRKGEMLSMFTEKMRGKSVWDGLVDEKYYDFWLKKHPHNGEDSIDYFVYENTYGAIVNAYNPRTLSIDGKISREPHLKSNTDVTMVIVNDIINKSAKEVEKEIIRMLKEYVHHHNDTDNKLDDDSHFKNLGIFLLLELVNRCYYYKTGRSKTFNDGRRYKLNNTYIFNMEDYMMSLPPHVKKIFGAVDDINIVVTPYMDKGEFLVIPDIENVIIYPPLIEYSQSYDDENMNMGYSYKLNTSIEIVEEIEQDKIPIVLDFQSNLKVLEDNLYYSGRDIDIMKVVF